MIDFLKIILSEGILVYIAYIIASKLNIMKFSVIPKDQQLACCVSIYIALLSTFCRLMFNKISKNRLNIQVIFFSKDDEPDISHTPTINLGEFGNELKISIEVKGSKKRIKGKVIKIPKQQFVTMQEATNEDKLKIAKIDKDGNYIIELENLYSDNLKQNIEIEKEFRIALSKEVENFRTVVEPILESKEKNFLCKIMVNFKYNKFNINSK